MPIKLSSAFPQTRSILLILLIFVTSLEDTVRKYIFSSSLVSTLKFIPAFCLCLIGFISLSRFARTLCFINLAITLPLLVTFPVSPSQWAYAMYDYLGLSLITYFFFRSIKSIDYIPKSPYILKCIVLFGTLNSLLIIIQSILGPTHWLSQTVDQEFSQHTYKFASFFLQKAPGLLSTSSSILSLCALTVLLIPNLKLFRGIYTRLFIFIVCISPIFNLSSRTYAFGIALYLMLYLAIRYFLMLASSASRKSTFLIILPPLAIIIFIITWFVGIFQTSYFLNSRVFASDTIYSRLIGVNIEDILNINFFNSLPLLIGGAGLGFSVNGNPAATNLPHFCQDLMFGIEFEFPRLACLFGKYGYMIVLMRLLLCFFLVQPILNLRFKEGTVFSSLYSMRIFLFVSILGGLPFEQNTSIISLVYSGITIYILESTRYFPIVMDPKSLLKNPAYSARMG